MTPDLDMAVCLPSLQEAAARTAALLKTVPDAQAKVPGLSWTAAETAAHLTAELQLYTAFVTGERNAADYLDQAGAAKTPGERTAVANARVLQELTERDTSRLAEMMLAAVEDFSTASGQRPHDEPVLTTAGLAMTVPVMAAALLGEQLIHGYDISRSRGARWRISRRDALLVIAGVMSMVPSYVDSGRAAGLHLTYELRFRGGSRYRLVIEDGTATVGAATGTADCVITADPVAFLLVGYGRVGQWGQVLRGKIVASGRKPWLGPKFGQLLTSI